MRYAYLDTSKNCAQNVADLKIKLDIWKELALYLIDVFKFLSARMVES